MPAPQIVNTHNAYGYTDADGGDTGSSEERRAGGTIAAKAVVAVGTTGLVTTALTNAPAPVIGVARDSATTGRSVQVITEGPVHGVACDGAIAAGNILKASATTAGRVAATATPAAGEALGFAIAASAAGTVSVYMAKAL